MTLIPAFFLHISGTECLRKMIGEFGGISTLAKIVQVPPPLHKGVVSPEPIKVSGNNMFTLIVDYIRLLGSL